MRKNYRVLKARTHRMSDKERDERLMRQLAWAYYRATPPEEMSDPSDKVTP